jgi:hypothetical protein
VSRYIITNYNNHYESRFAKTLTSHASFLPLTPIRTTDWPLSFPSSPCWESHRQPIAAPTSGRCTTMGCLSRPALFAWLISHQPAVLFSQNKPVTSNQPAVLFSQNKPAPAISHQPTEQAARATLVIAVWSHYHERTTRGGRWSPHPRPGDASATAATGARQLTSNFVSF